jgi:AAA15 family ATPase/GTPase
MSDLHLDSLEITNFRCFDHLVIEKLGRVNLIVGKNGVGKTCLLEALLVYARKADPRTLQMLLAHRDEFVMGEPVNQADIDLFASLFADSLKNLFFGRILALGKTKAAIGNKKTSKIEFGLDAYSVEGDNTGRIKSLRILVPEEYELAENMQVRLTVDENSTQKLSMSLLRLDQVRKLLPKSGDIIGNIFIPTTGLENNILGDFWDNIALSDLEVEVTKALQIIDQQIEKFAFVKNPPFRYPVIKRQSDAAPMPLRSFGEGLIRILGIALTLANAKNGILLIDEFETGLHHQVQADLWKIIFRLANQLNVQVFATTHSWDCVEAFQEAAAEDRNEEAMLIRLQRKKDGSGIEAESYNERLLGMATRQGVEVR